MLSNQVKAQWSAVVRRVEMQEHAVVVEAGLNRRHAAVIVNADWYARAVAAIGEPSGGVEPLAEAAKDGVAS